MLTSILEAVGLLLAALLAGAGTVGYYRANVARSTIELYKGDNEALRLRLSTVESQRADDALQIISLQAEIKSLRSAQDHLTAVVTQSTEIASMRVVVDRIASKLAA